MHRQGPGRGAAGTAAAAAWQRARRLPGGGDDTATGEEDPLATDRAPRRPLAAAGAGGGLLLPLELERQVTGARRSPPSVIPEREWIHAKARMYFTYLYRNEMFSNERVPDAGAPQCLSTINANESTTSRNYVSFILFFLFHFTTILQMASTKREVFVSMVLYAKR